MHKMIYKSRPRLRRRVRFFCARDPFKAGSGPFLLPPDHADYPAAGLADDENDDLSTGFANDPKILVSPAAEVADATHDTHLFRYGHVGFTL